MNRPTLSPVSASVIADITVSAYRTDSSGSLASLAAQSLLKHQEAEVDARCRRGNKEEMLLLHESGSVKVGEIVRFDLSPSYANALR